MILVVAHAPAVYGGYGGYGGYGYGGYAHAPVVAKAVVAAPVAAYHGKPYIEIIIISLA